MAFQMKPAFYLPQTAHGCVAQSAKVAITEMAEASLEIYSILHKHKNVLICIHWKSLRTFILNFTDLDFNSFSGVFEYDLLNFNN